MFSTKVGPRRAAPGLNRQPARLRGKAVLATLSVLAPLLLLPALNSAAAPSAPTATPSIVVTSDQVGSGFDDGWVDVDNRLVWVWPACRARLEDAGMAIRTVSTDELAAATFGPGRSCAKLLKLVPPVPTTTEPPTTAPPAPPTTPEPPAPEPPAPQPPAPQPPAPQPPAPEPPAPTGGWAFEETFDGDPAAPSQILLPDTFDYVVTHRTHPKAHFEPFAPFPADHGPDCAGPNPDVVPLPQHDVTTSHLSRLDEPDQSFFICKNHMMSAMGDVEGYSVSAFWPRQEFDFADGGVLEFDVNINAGHPRSWFEVMLTPRDQLRLGSANEWLPIDETYPADRIVLRLFHDERQVEVGTGAIDPNGVLAEQHDFGWQNRYPDDPATTDRRIRRTMRVQLTDSAVIWAIEREDGSFDEYRTDVPGGLPFDRGLVVFKTHAYTPTKDGNTNVYTFHWDNIRFDGPKLTPYRRSEANDVVYLQANGDRQVGESQTVTIDLSETGPDPVLVGQVHSPLQGQVLLSINGGPNQPIHPPEYTTSDCTSSGWKTFQSPLDPAQLEVGTNTLTWTIGPRPPCAQSWLWDGFSVKALHIQTGG